MRETTWPACGRAGSNQTGTKHGGYGRAETCGAGRGLASAAKPGGELCRFCAHRKPAVRVRAGVRRPAGQADRQGQAWRRRHHRAGQRRGARLRHQPVGADQGSARRSRQGGSRGPARRFCQFRTRFPRRTEGPERRVGPDGRSLRRQGSPCPHYGWRLLASRGRRGGGRGNLRGFLSGAVRCVRRTG
jgi:hypothetical protein